MDYRKQGCQIQGQSRLVSKQYEKPRNNGKIVFCRDSQAKSVPQQDKQSFGSKKHRKRAENSKKNQSRESCKRMEKAPSIIQDRAEAIHEQSRIEKSVKSGQDRNMKK